MAERYSRVKPVINKSIPTLVPKPLVSLSPKTNFATPDVKSMPDNYIRVIALPATTIESLPTIVSDAEFYESSKNCDEESCSSSTASLSMTICKPDVTLSSATDLVDALYELPTQGEWEQLILPRGGNQPLLETQDLVAV